MRLKNIVFLVVILALVLASLGIVKALTYNCDFRLASNCNATSLWNKTAMKIYDTTNAHGEVYNGVDNYNYVICCNFPNSTRTTSCSTDTNGDGYYENKILSLSSSTNAHAEVPKPITQIYTTDVCYDGLECVDVSDFCPGDFPIELLSISGTTNAHIGMNWAYSKKICCKNLNEPAATQSCESYGGHVCISPNICTDGITSPTTNDSLGPCCNIACCTPDNPAITCQGPPQKICDTMVNNCGQTISCGPHTQPCSTTFGTCAVSGTGTCKADQTGYTCDAVDPRPNNCLNKNCGSDLCGNSNGCGTCTGGQICNATGRCETPACVPTTCGTRVCGTIANGTCPGTLDCGTCSVGTCNATGQCETTPCSLTTSSWSSSKVTNGTTVTMTVNGNGDCNGKSVTFDIAEVDCAIGPCKYSNMDVTDTNKLSVKQKTGTFSGTTATATWIAEWVQDTGLFTDSDPEYAFKATVPSDSLIIDNSGELKVNLSSSIVNPVARIASPKDRSIYFLPNVLNFEHASTGTIDTITWEFGGEVHIEGETGTFTSYNLTGARIYDKLNVTYLTTGQKVIKLIASNNLGGVGKAQISILVIASPFVMAYISSPMPYTTVQTNRGEVGIDADGAAGSFVVEGKGDITDHTKYNVTCLAGFCPNETEGTIQGFKISVINWSTATALNASDFLEFDWGFSGTSQTRNGRGNVLNMVTFNKSFGSVGDNWVSLILKYYEGETIKAESSTRNEFTVLRNSTTCSEDGTQWIAPDNTRSSSLNNCRIGANTCCPSLKDCNNAGTCVATNTLLCSGFTDSVSCPGHGEPNGIAANSIRTKYNNPDLKLGDVIGTDPVTKCDSILDAWWCAWESGACVAKMNVSSLNCGDGTYPGGVCTYSESSNDNCDDGILTYSWTAGWQGTGIMPIECKDGSKSIACPAQIKLGFFDNLQLAITLLVITLIYCMLLLDRKLKKFYK